MRKRTRVQPILSKNFTIKGRREMLLSVERDAGSRGRIFKIRMSWYFHILIGMTKHRGTGTRECNCKSDALG